MTTLVERLEDRPNADHERGCEGRNYRCSCGFDAEWGPLLSEAAATITRLEVERDYAWQEKKNAEAYLKPERANAIAAEARAEAAEAEVVRLREALQLILPLAKGYAGLSSSARVCREWVESAEAALQPGETS